MADMKLFRSDYEHRARVLRDLAANTHDQALAAAYRQRAREYDAEALSMEQPVRGPLLTT
jgi:hypothetical protein